MPILEKKTILKSMIFVSTLKKKTDKLVQTKPKASTRKERNKDQSINQLKRKQKNRNKTKPKADL